MAQRSDGARRVRAGACARRQPTGGFSCGAPPKNRLCLRRRGVRASGHTHAADCAPWAPPPWAPPVCARFVEAFRGEASRRITGGARRRFPTPQTAHNTTANTATANAQPRGGARFAGGGAPPRAGAPNRHGSRDARRRKREQRTREADFGVRSARANSVPGRLAPHPICPCILLNPP